MLFLSSEIRKYFRILSYSINASESPYYIKKYTEEEKAKLYEDIADKELIESDFLLSTVLGVKSFEDLFGDTTQEKKEQLTAAVKNLDLKIKNL